MEDPVRFMISAAKNDEWSKIQKALTQGADVNGSNQHGNTVAHTAAAFGALACIRGLHSVGANFAATNGKGQTPLDAANLIGEEDAAALITALLAGKSGDGIGDSMETDETAQAMGAVTPRSQAHYEKLAEELGDVTFREGPVLLGHPTNQ